MLYFKSQIGPEDDKSFVITIHCDVSVFEWLLRYIREPHVQTRKINRSNVISILVSGDFLKIPGLDVDCARFIGQQFDAINALNIDFTSLS